VSMQLEWIDRIPQESSNGTGHSVGAENRPEEESSIVGEQQPKLLIADRVVESDVHSSWVEAAARLNAPPQDDKNMTLDQCFDHFTKPERLDEQNMWYCSECKEHVRAMKSIELWRLPNILIVHLKRFEFRSLLRRDKLEAFVDFPLDGLDMAPHCAAYTNCDPDALVDGIIPAEYDLFAVVNHFGRMGFGHYTAFARPWDETGISPEWTLFDDSSTRGVGDGNGTVASPAAYVLFYRRRIFG